MGSRGGVNRGSAEIKLLAADALWFFCSFFFFFGKKLLFCGKAYCSLGFF